MKSYVVYFDHQTGASHAIHGSKSSFHHFNIFFCHKWKTKEKVLKGGKYTKAFRCYSMTLTDTKIWSTPGKKKYFEFLEFFDDVK